MDLFYFREVKSRKVIRTVFFLFFIFQLNAEAQTTAGRLTAMNGEKIGFYQYLPPGYNNDTTTKYPMIIFLHGIGEKGNGLEPAMKQLNCCGIPKFIVMGYDMRFTWNGKTEGFVVIYPQLASRYTTWQNYYVDEMIRFGKSHLRIDTNRIFLTGLSLGGGASWVYASASVNNGKKLAGIVPVVSPCFLTNGCNVANAKLPVLTVHAVDDTIANPACNVNTIQAVIDCGAEVRPNTIQYVNGGHFVWVKRAYDPSYRYNNPTVYEWMLAQNRSFKPNKKPIVKVSGNITIPAGRGTTVLDASASVDPDGKIVRFIWTKISGPSSGMLTHELDSRANLKELLYPGVYTYEVRVIDDRAEWSSARMKVTVLAGTALK